MNPIIRGNEILIPMSIGEKSNVNTPHDAIPVQKINIDFWALIDKLSWVDADDNIGATRNPRCPSVKWTQDEFREVQHEIRAYYDKIQDEFVTQNFWGQHNTVAADQPKILWHIIARGKQIYTAVITDTTFAIAFLEQECGFLEFMKRFT